MFKDHLEQLLKVGHLMEFMVNQGGIVVGQTSGTNDSLLKVIERSFSS